jgi:citrate lyase beta subunit
MDPRWIFQYVSLNQKPEKLLQIVRKLARCSFNPILDLEDSMQIPLDPNRTAQLKSNARNYLRQLIGSLNDEDKKANLYLRLNSVENREFINDLSLLREVGDQVWWKGFFLPKIHSAAVLEQYFNKLQNIAFEEMIVMIESERGVNNLDEILDMAGGMPVRIIHYGHWDYFLDIKEFPIPLPTTENFWEIVRSVILKIENKGFHYLHTPFCYIFDHDTFSSVIALLEAITRLKFGVSTLVFSQSMAACKISNHVTALQPVRMDYSKKDKALIAEQLLKTFQRTEADFSFNINKKEFRFHAPHEFLCALDYINHANGIEQA